MADQAGEGGEQNEQADEVEKADEADEAKVEEAKAEESAKAEAEDTKAEGEGEIRPADAFKKGMGLLWQAAKSAAEEVKREVEKGQVTETLQQAGKELETAATHAAKALEDFIGRTSPKPPKYEDKWPPEGDAKGDVPAPKQADADIPDAKSPDDGGTDESGERRDMRIQVEEDKNGKGGKSDG